MKSLSYDNPVISSVGKTADYMLIETANAYGLATRTIYKATFYCIGGY